MSRGATRLEEGSKGRGEMGSRRSTIQEQNQLRAQREAEREIYDEEQPGRRREKRGEESKVCFAKKRQRQRQRGPGKKYHSKSDGRWPGWDRRRCGVGAAQIG